MIVSKEIYFIRSFNAIANKTHLIDFRKTREAQVLTRSPNYCKFKEERMRRILIPGVCCTQTICLKLYNVSRTYKEKRYVQFHQDKGEDHQRDQAIQ